MKPVTLCLLLSLGLAVAARAQTYEEQVLEIVNQERWNNGQLPPLKGVLLLDGCAEGHSAAMAQDDFFGHCNPFTGTSPFDRMTSAGYSWNWAGENVAAGYGTPQAVMAGWMASSGHRANILSSNFYEMGNGYVQQTGDQGGISLIDATCGTYGSGGPYYKYWTQNFGRRSGIYPVVINREAYSTGDLHVDLYVYGQGWASQMRFQNEDGPWSAWEPYAADKSWTLSAGDGTKTVHAEIKNASGSVKSAEDVIELAGSVTAVADDVRPVIQPAFPNPFRQSTTLRYSLDAEVPVNLEVVDINGRVVQLLDHGLHAAGIYQAAWDGRDGSGRPVANGVYFLHLVAGSAERVAKVVLRR